jgi:hypothetical protein
VELTVEYFPGETFGQSLEGFVERLVVRGSGHAEVTGGLAGVGLHDSVLGRVGIPA